MKNLAQKPLIKKLIILAISLLVFAFLLVSGADWFYKSNWLLENPTASSIRRRMDDYLVDAFRHNFLGYRDYALEGVPGMYTWRPFRIVPDLDLPETWDGNTDYYSIYAEVAKWIPEEDTIEAYTYLPKPGYLKLNIGDGLDTKLIVPLVDDVGRPIPSESAEIDTDLVTKDMLYRYIDTFDSAEDLARHVDQFNTVKDLSTFLAYGFAGFSQDILVKDLHGHFEWADAFCETDMLIVGFSKDRGLEAITSLDHEATVTPDLVIMNQGGCGVTYSELVDVPSEPSHLDLPVILPDPHDADAWYQEYDLFLDFIRSLENYYDGGEINE